jgi:hypothetical protein
VVVLQSTYDDVSITKSIQVLQEATTEVNDCEEYLCYTRESLEPFGSNLPLVHNLIQVPIRFLGPYDSEYEFAALVDTVTSGTFYHAKTVQHLNFTPQGSCVLVRNGDGTSQYSLVSISPRIAIGVHFTGNGLIFLYALTVFGMQRDMICHTICTVCQIFILNAKGKASQFKTVTWSFQIKIDFFRMSQCLKNFMTSLLPLHRLPRLGKLICNNGRFLDKILLGCVIRPAACFPGELQHKVKLKLKEGAQIRSKKPYRIPEAYRDDL